MSTSPRGRLAADIDFPSAIDAVTEGDHTEALRLLEIVEYRYPTPVAAKAKRTAKRLQNLSGPSTVE